MIPTSTRGLLAKSVTCQSALGAPNHGKAAKGVLTRENAVGPTRSVLTRATHVKSVLTHAKANAVGLTRSVLTRANQ